jgi:DUF4097 and DUF4098 domain-containing protein YvlB
MPRSQRSYLMSASQAAGLLGLLALGAAPFVARAGHGVKPVNETRTIAATGHISVDCVSGRVEVTGWDEDKFTITGTIPEDCTLEIKEGDGSLEAKVHWPRFHRGGKNDEADLKVQVPRACVLSVSAVSADVAASGLGGKVHLAAVSGNIEAHDSPESIDASSVSGDIHLTAQTKRVTAESVSGEIILDGPSGEVEVSTVSGDLQVKGGPFRHFKANSVSGDLRFEGTATTDGKFDLNSHSGSIELWLPADISADIEAQTFSGDISNEFAAKSRHSHHGSIGEEVTFSTGSGDAKIDLNTFSGDVSIHKK